MAGEEILIVDDNATNLKLARLLLESDDYHVRTATDAEEAQHLLEAWHPELVLMDVQLPGMDGLELTRIMKTNPATRGIVVLALTAYAMKGDEQKARVAGCDGYVTKPIDAEALLALVARHLRRGGGAP